MKDARLQLLARLLVSVKASRRTKAQITARMERAFIEEKRNMSEEKPLPPLRAGIYFGLDEVRYHSDPAVGSTDIRRLRRSAPDYWWHSHMNPARPPIDEAIFARNTPSTAPSRRGSSGSIRSYAARLA